MQKDLSQTELGKITGIHYNQIGRYEKGTSHPSAENANRLAEALGVSSDYLINGDTSNAARASFADQELLNLFQKASELTPENKDAIKRIVNAMFQQQKIEELSRK